MDEPAIPFDLLRDPQVKAHFMQLLDNPLSAEEKYQRFVEFCAQRELLRGWMPVSGGRSAEDSTAEPSEDTADLLEQVLNSAGHAIERMRRSQHQDGGWGLQIEQSNFWHTAYVVLFLRAAQDLPEQAGAGGVGEMLRRGVAYLEQHSEYWAMDALSTVDSLSIYEIGLMVRCFYRAGRSFLRRESGLRVYRSIDRLYHSQNEDGGWDANLWGYEVSSPVRMWSEVGSTSMVLQALAETHDERFHSTMEKGIAWLAEVQNPDGSWNDGSSQPGFPAFQITGQSSVIKTCDALQGILTGEALDIPLQPYRACIASGIGWLCRQESPVLNRQRRMNTWGVRYSLVDYENTCLTLETLLRLPQVSMSALVDHAAWLVQSQRRQPDDPEDGCWVLGHTARIGLALASFYRRATQGLDSQRAPWIA